MKSISDATLSPKSDKSRVLDEYRIEITNHEGELIEPSPKELASPLIPTSIMPAYKSKMKKKDSRRSSLSGSCRLVHKNNALLLPIERINIETEQRSKSASSKTNSYNSNSRRRSSLDPLRNNDEATKVTSLHVESSKWQEFMSKTLDLHSVSRRRFLQEKQQQQPNPRHTELENLKQLMGTAATQDRSPCGRPKHSNATVKVESTNQPQQQHQHTIVAESVTSKRQQNTFHKRSKSALPLTISTPTSSNNDFYNTSPKRKPFGTDQTRSHTTKGRRTPKPHSSNGSSNNGKPLTFEEFLADLGGEYDLEKAATTLLILDTSRTAPVTEQGQSADTRSSTHDGGHSSSEPNSRSSSAADNLAAIEPLLSPSLYQRRKGERSQQSRQPEHKQNNNNNPTKPQILFSTNMINKIKASLKEEEDSSLKTTGSSRGSTSGEASMNSREEKEATTIDTEFKIWKRNNNIPENKKVFHVFKGWDDLEKQLRIRGWFENPDVNSPYADLKFTMHPHEIDFRHLDKRTIVNHFENISEIASKNGLCRNLKNLVWIESVDPNTFYPRCYDLSIPDELQLFIDDFKLCAAESILKRLITSTPNDGGDGNFFARNLPIVESALRACEKKIKEIQYLRDDDNDFDRDFELVVTEAEWTNILQFAADPASCPPHLTTPDENLESVLRIKSEAVLKKLKALSNQYNIDGDRNVWVVKSGGLSKGKGVKLSNSIKSIFNFAQGRDNDSFVVQKYIENPLTINNRKFDIRQYVLITDMKPLTVWFYQDAYLRFCSHEFDTNNLEDSFAHLTNTAVQSRSKEYGFDECMWHSDDFVKFLKSQYGNADIWTNHIRDSMKKIVLWCLKSGSENIVHRKNTYELLCFDFIIDSDYRVWLLKVNTSPDLSHTTKVKSLLCPKITRDLLKVIFDLKNEIRQYEQRKNRERQRMLRQQQQQQSVLTSITSKNDCASDNSYDSDEADEARKQCVEPHDKAFFQKFDTGKWECIYRSEDIVPHMLPITFASNLYIVGRSIKNHYT